MTKMLEILRNSSKKTDNNMLPFANKTKVGKSIMRMPAFSGQQLFNSVVVDEEESKQSPPVGCIEGYTQDQIWSIT